MTVDLQNLCTAPPMEYMLIFNSAEWDDKDTGVHVECETLEELQEHDVIWFNSLGDHRPLRCCHLCAFTGYTDSKGEKVYGGQVFFIDIVFSKTNRTKAYFVVEWDTTEQQWYRRCLKDNKRYTFKKEDVGRGHFIGHIHIKPWPEEVAALLKGESDDS